MTNTLCDPGCAICSGQGVVRYEREVHDPKFGKLEPCPNREQETLSTFVRSGLDPSEYHLRWEDLYNFKENNIKGAERTLRKTLEDGYGMIFFHGGWGLGKTALMKVAVSVWLDSNRGNAAYANTVEILDIIQKVQFDPDGDNVKGDLTYMSNCRLLAMDEFDKVRDTPYASEKRFQLLDERYVMASRKQAVTLIASNAPPSEYDGYIVDRLRDGRGHIIELTGKSVRPGLSNEEDEDEAD